MDGPGRILVAEDDDAVRRSVERALRFEGFDVLTAADGETAVEMVESQRPAAVVLDVMMPRADGLAVTRRLRAGGDRTPILMLTARHELTDRVAGLDAGADDYLVKPFALEELLARVRALLRRSDAPAGTGPLRVEDLELDIDTRQVHRDGREVVLT